jgi:flagellar basal-body rod protein FlgC
MDLFKSMKVAASGLRVQSGRMKIIAENIANAESTAKTPGGKPYQRKIPTFREVFDREIGATIVRQGRVELDKSSFGEKFDPGNPAADERGMVKTPNVNTLIEMVDMREAQRSYEANLNVIGSSRRMLARTLDILKG